MNFYFLTLLMIGSILSLFSISLGNNSLSFLINIVLSFFVLFNTKEKNVLHLMFGIGFVFFILLPYVVYSAIGYFISGNYYLVILLFCALFFFLTKNIEVLNLSLKKYPYYKYTFIFFISLIFLIATKGYLFIFLSGLLILFISRGMSYFNYKDLIIYVLPYFIFFIIYSTFYWSGFGRLILAGNLIYPILYWLKFSKLKIKNIYIYFSAIIVGCALSILRFKEEQLSLDVLLKDSSLGPFRRGHDIYSDIESYSFNLLGFLDQFSLMIFSFIPREIWTNKPKGFGRLYVENEMDTTIFSEEHSIAGLFSGDFFYFLNYYSILILPIFLILFVGLLKKLNYRFSNINHVALIYMPTFVWGGMASFGARFSLVCAFLIIWLIMENLVKKSLIYVRH